VSEASLAPAQCSVTHPEWRNGELKRYISPMAIDHIKNLVREVPNFPKAGIVFRDITPLLRDAAAFAEAIHHMSAFAKKQGAEIVAAPESRGFIFGSAIAVEAGMGFVPIRKPGKLPWKTRGATYALEYGSDRLEIHEDAIRKGQRVLLVDDVLATGGTMKACCDLVREAEATVTGISFLIELAALNGRSKLGAMPIHAVLGY
jgi:adenine phosphoribosyltransferase